jgi:hypothetical protein
LAKVQRQLTGYFLIAAQHALFFGAAGEFEARTYCRQLVKTVADGHAASEATSSIANSVIARMSCLVFAILMKWTS